MGLLMMDPPGVAGVDLLAWLDFPDAEPEPAVDWFDRWLFGADARDDATRPTPAPDPYPSVTFAASGWSDDTAAARGLLPCELRAAILAGTPRAITVDGREYQIVARPEDLPGWPVERPYDRLSNRYLPDEGCHDYIAHAADHGHDDAEAGDEWEPTLVEIALATAGLRKTWSAYDLLSRSGRLRGERQGSPRKMGFARQRAEDDE